MSKAVTSCPAAARVRAVHPAPAMQKTRLRGLNARSSMLESSYVVPNVSPRCRALKGPRRHGVEVASSVCIMKTILRNNPDKHQKCEVLQDHAGGIWNQMPGPNQATRIHGDKQDGLHDRGLPHPAS